MAAKSGMEGAGHRGAGRLVRVAGKLIALDEESARIVLAFQQEKRDRAARRPKRSLEEVVERRRAGVERRAEVLEARTCPRTGAGVVVSRDRRDGRMAAEFFRPRAFRSPFRREALTSAHARLAVLDRLAEILAAERTAKAAPHDLEVGEIVVRAFSYRGCYVDFFRVVDVPHPRKVTLVELRQRLVSGAWWSGSVVPDEAAAPRGEAATHWVRMEQGEARIVRGRHRDAQRWDGRPVEMCSD